MPAPKAQRWGFKDGQWVPRETQIPRKIRPLAHVALRDQVIATAMMICLADKVETMAGDPRLSARKEKNRRRILAYGHRLFCDTIGDSLQHRWGSSKLYRQHFQDYQAFLERPKIVSDALSKEHVDSDIAIVHADLSKFYDRVQPELLHAKVGRLIAADTDDERAFSNLFRQLFDWRWSDPTRASAYGKANDISGFLEVALPQGLVASGFFANVLLQDFERSLRAVLGKPVTDDGELILEDACYYVDDFRLVLRAPKGASEDDLKQRISAWLQSRLNVDAPGLVVEPAKTKVIVRGRDRRFLVPQSRAAKRIQHEVSGAFDMLHGTELIGEIEGFFHTQQRYPSETPSVSDRTGLLVGVSDMRDDTAARFAAGKYRRTFRSLRPLLAGDHREDDAADNEPDRQPQVDEERDDDIPTQLVLTKQQLDDRAKLFAALLIDEWTSNPGNVRLLRIAVDLYPSSEFLEQVLAILRPGWSFNGVRGVRKEIRIYCLAELFRAAATETAMVSDDDCLPAGVSVDDYHARLVEHGREILKHYLMAASPAARFPWYLMQQVFLYLAARNAFPTDVTTLRAKGGRLLQHYRQFARFLSGGALQSLEERSIFLAVATTGFGLVEQINALATETISDEFLSQITDIAPALGCNVWARWRDNAPERLVQVARRLGLERSAQTKSGKSLVDLAERQENPFFEEENLLHLASWLLSQESETFLLNSTPSQIDCKLDETAKGFSFGRIGPDGFSFNKSARRVATLFTAPEWCESDEEKHRYGAGLLLRYALRGSIDVYGRYSPRTKRVHQRYVRPTSHWEQQRYSTFQGRSAFGPPWLPISSFTEDLLFQLLRWPGAGVRSPVKPLAELLAETSSRLSYIRAQRGEVTAVTFLEQNAPWPDIPPIGDWKRELRVGMVQSVLPDHDDYARHPSDPELSGDVAFRNRHRQHLAAVMEAVAQMLRVRETHRGQNRDDQRVIDLLIFPELAIHPDDIDPVILPFVRRHKCIVLFGQVYHRQPSLPANPLINSCMWLIPEWTPSAGFHVRRVEQGKQHLSVEERQLNPQPTGFRPAQWLIRYRWHSDLSVRPLILTASICYDATDLKLASDLRSRSDVYIVCALNKDVGTFDRMSEGLHYHMYQGVIVVNNGQFGGSSFYMPFGENFRRQVLHVHGQPQVSISIAEVSPQKLTGRPANLADAWPLGDWKTQPAAWQPIV